MITIEEFKKTLGKTGEKMSDEEIQKLMAVFDNLSDSWLDQVEIGIFGKTIQVLTQDENNK